MKYMLITLLVVAQLIFVNLPEGLLMVNRDRRTPSTPLPVVTLRTDAVNLGIYDPAGAFSGVAGATFEHVYQPWKLEDTRELVTLVRQVRAKNRVPLVSLEPWPFEWNGLVKETLFADIVQGSYDPSINTVCQALSNEMPQEILLRWGYEMELTGHFPWAQADPEGFVAAYRHFVDTCRAAGAANVRFVWSPAGMSSLSAFWPGDAYVDFVGLTALGFGEWDVFRGAEQPLSFVEIFHTRYSLVEAYGKPIIICEFGVAGPQAHQARWLANAFESLAAYPLLRGVSYFDAIDPLKWDNFKVPDWRITPDMFLPLAG